MGTTIAFRGYGSCAGVRVRFDDYDLLGAIVACWLWSANVRMWSGFRDACGTAAEICASLSAFLVCGRISALLLAPFWVPCLALLPISSFLDLDDFGPDGVETQVTDVERKIDAYRSAR